MSILSELPLCFNFQIINLFLSLRPNNKVFANLIINLPSRYTGGQDKITFRQEKRHLQSTSEDSMTATAWYSDAEYDIGPITSGYRLFLLNRITHMPPTPVPSLPMMIDNLEKVRKLLGIWAESPSKPRMLVFPIKPSTKYGEEVSTVAQECSLTRADGFKLQEVSSPLGFKTFFAVLHCHMEGTPDNEHKDVQLHSGPGRWSKPYYDDHSPPAMIQSTCKSLILKDVADLDGDPYIHMDGWQLEVSDLVLQIPLERSLPDTIEYEGSANNVSP